jgi:catechol 2,3-dioxygenase-like lactoylglutathione lyase family enzyme
MVVELQQLKRGRLIDHVQLVVADLAASRRFYDAVLGILRIDMEGEGDGFCWADELVLSSADSPAAQGRLTGRVHLAFQANDRRQVEACYRAGLAAGGRDNGAPGERPNYHPGYYAAFLIDPDGNNVEVVFHGASQRSADAVTIAFQNPAG